MNASKQKPTFGFTYIRGVEVRFGHHFDGQCFREFLVSPEARYLENLFHVEH